jgi:hypothetical protein
MDDFGKLLPNKITSASVHAGDEVGHSAGSLTGAVEIADRHLIAGLGLELSVFSSVA